ncbi:MAG: DUF2933 domain-containing protein [Nitrospirota bacterium]
MDWIRENWVFLLFSLLFIAMHLFGHGMHGGHGGEEGEEHKGHSGGSTEKQKKRGHGCC